jgi:nickel-dependent lactate racemase
VVSTPAPVTTRSAAILGDAAGVLDPADLDEFVTAQVAALDLRGRVCVVVPDTTRSCPLPELLAAVHRALAGRVDSLTVLVALGTHPEIPPDALARWVGADRLPGVEIIQHAWWDPATFVEVGVVPAAELAELSGGLLVEDVPVRVNRAVLDHDALLVVGPVFPHEVVGFSGGDKYFFPGISGPEVIDTSHWLGALITSAAIIGTPGITPVRALVHAAAALLPCRRVCVAVAVASGTHDVHTVAVSEPPEQAWAAAAAVSAQIHVRYLDRPVRRVLSIVSERYDEMWTAAKGLYKLEPVIADGGEITLWAPHVRAVSHTFGPDIERVGYHCRDWVLAHLTEFPDVSRSVLAHCTHARGAGRLDPDGTEHCRYSVTLATGLDRATTDRLAVGWRDPQTIDPADWASDPDALVVPDAGEVLYRLAP